MTIPAEYVVGVLEVKSSFNSTIANEGIKHLADLSPLKGGPEDPKEKYKLYLPQNFFCGLVFFENRKSVQFSEKAQSRVISGIKLHGFMGGLILRGENLTKPISGCITILQSETPIETTIGKSKTSLLGGAAMTKSVPIVKNLHFCAMLKWTEINFSQFAFDMLAMMRGTYEVAHLSSSHGLGTSDLEDSL